MSVAEMGNPSKLEAYPVSSLHPSRTFIWALAAIKAAAARANWYTGCLDAARAEAILQAARDVAEGLWDGYFAMDPLHAGPGDYARLANRIIAARADQILEGHADRVENSLHVYSYEHVNQNQSNAEAISAALRIGCLRNLDELLEPLRELTSTLGTGPLVWADAPKQRQSDPQTGGGAWMSRDLREELRLIGRNADCVRVKAEALRHISMRAASNVRPEIQSQMLKALIEITGLPLSPADHSFQSMQAVAEIDAFSTALRNLLVSLRRAAGELHGRVPAWSTGENASASREEGRLDEAVFRLQSCDLTIAVAAKAGAAELNRFMPVIAYILFAAVEGLTEAARQLTEHIPGNPGSYSLQPRGFPIPETLLASHSFDPKALY